MDLKGTEDFEVCLLCTEIADALVNQDRYEEAVVYYQKALEFEEPGEV